MSSDVTPASRMERWRRPLLVICALRFIIPIAAIPLLFTWTREGAERIPALTLLRPGKEVLLIAGGFAKVGRIPGSEIPLVFLAYIPGMILVVWAFFALGRAYADELDAGGGPAWLTRMVPPARLAQARRVIAKRGVSVAIFGRVAALPPTIMAVAAGTTNVDPKRYLGADLIGAIVSFGVTVGVGYGLGAAYESGGKYLLIGGLVLFFIGAQLFTKWLDEEAETDDPALDQDAPASPA